VSKTNNGKTTVAVKNSNLGWLAAIVVVVLIVPNLFSSLGGTAVKGAANAANELTTPVPGNFNKMEKQKAQHTPTASTIPQDEMDARMAAKQAGDKLPPLAPPIQPGAGLPTLSNPSPGGGIIGELPVIGGALNGAAKALGPGMKALNP
jgi:hypothetical protein